MKRSKNKKIRKSWKTNRNIKLKKSRENETTSSGLNKKSIQNKPENQRGILQIVNKYFVTKKEEKIIEKISYYVTILKKFIQKEKQIRKTESELMK